MEHFRGKGERVRLTDGRNEGGSELKRWDRVVAQSGFVFSISEFICILKAGVSQPPRSLCHELPEGLSPHPHFFRLYV